MTTNINQSNANYAGNQINNQYINLNVNGSDVNIEELLELLQSKRSRCNKIEVKNLSINILESREKYKLDTVRNNDYLFSTFFSVKFEGEFGSSPNVYLIYSKNDSPISLDDREYIEIISLENKGSTERCYTYSLSREYSYRSKCDVVLKEYIIIVQSRDEPQNIGFVVVLMADKRIVRSRRSPATSFITELPLEFSSNPEVCYKGSWPTSVELFQICSYSGNLLMLRKENINAILELEDYIQK